jgi:hypothetical protein
LFRDDCGAPDGIAIDTFEPSTGDLVGAEAVESIFAGLASDRLEAARKTLAYLDGGGDPRVFTDTAQRMIYLKGTDSHDYKFSSAVIEDYKSLSPEFRNRFLAASVHWLKGASEPESPLVARSRAALG